MQDTTQIAEHPGMLFIMHLLMDEMSEMLVNFIESIFIRENVPLEIDNGKMEFFD